LSTTAVHNTVHCSFNYLIS